MIAIHGGGWRSRDKGEFGLRTANAFTPEGYVVVPPNYVLSKPGNRPGREFRGRAGRGAVGAKPCQRSGRQPRRDRGRRRVGGRNLAALLGVYSTRASGGEVSSAVNAVVAVSTPANLTTLYHRSAYAGTAASQFLGGPPGRVHANYVAASPIDHVSPGDPPTFLVHGRGDPIIPVSQSKQLKAALAAASATESARPGAWRTRPRLPATSFLPGARGGCVSEHDVEGWGGLTG